jgi:hypothetical protein
MIKLPLIGLLIVLTGLAGCAPSNPQTKNVSIMAANEDGKPIVRKKIGECRFNADYSYQIKCERPEIAQKLAAAIKQARQKESLLLRTEEMVGDKLVMSGEMLKPGDQNYIHALIIESARLLNNDTRGEYFSLEP